MKKEAIAHPNIAVIKYWGKRDVRLNLPAVSSLSLTLSQFHTHTIVEWGSLRDHFVLNNEEMQDKQAQKVFSFLDRIDPNRPYCKVISDNNFPTAAGLASSASAFAALALAGSAASGQNRSLDEISILARQGSGSACRSLWGGWVEWKKGERSDGLDSHGVQIATKSHWDLRLIVAVVSDKKKLISSTKGMLQTANTSPMYDAWVQTAQEDVNTGRRAILNKDLDALGEAMEHSTLKMYSTMFTTKPAIRYWKPQSIAIMQEVERLRKSEISCWFTMDAGPNVKILCHTKDAEQVAESIGKHTSIVHILEAGGDAVIL